jgi:hypothetical protein
MLPLPVTNVHGHDCMRYHRRSARTIMISRSRVRRLSSTNRSARRLASSPRSNTSRTAQARHYPSGNRTIWTQVTQLGSPKTTRGSTCLPACLPACPPACLPACLAFCWCASSDLTCRICNLNLKMVGASHDRLHELMLTSPFVAAECEYVVAQGSRRRTCSACRGRTCSRSSERASERAA